jgi:RNA polymerase primary sigma factor
MITIYDIAEVDNQTAQDAEIFYKYLQKVGLEDLLSAEEEQELLARAVEGDEEAADKVMRANLRFVVSLSNQYQNKGLSLLQLFEISMQGLYDAIKASASRPNDERFIQFAVPFMRQAIEDAIYG